MKPKAAEIIEKARAWLKLQHYEGLEDLTLNQLRLELHYRYLMFRWIRDDLTLTDEETALAETCEDLIFFSGKPLVSHLRLPESPVTSDEHVQLITMGDLMKWERHTRRGAGEFPRDEKQVLQLSARERKQPVPSGPFVVNVKFDLWDSTDEEIIESVKAALPAWRKEKKVTEKKIGSFRFGISTIRKIIDFRIIQHLDLFYWLKRVGVKASDAVYARILFPDNSDIIRDGSHIKDTDRPLALRIWNKEIHRLFYLYVNKNSEYRDARVADLLERADD